MATRSDEQQCERCKEPNGWVLLDKEYKHLCGACAETRDAIYVGGYYRYGAKCSGTECNTVGIVNHETKFFCGKTYRCIP